MDQFEFASLRAEQKRAQNRTDESETKREEPVNRRNLLRGIGVAAVGAAAGGLALSRPAAAIDDDTLTIGNEIRTAQTPTRVVIDTFWSTPGDEVAAFTISTGMVREGGLFAEAAVGAYADPAYGDGSHGIGLWAGSTATGRAAVLDAGTPLMLMDSSLSGPPGPGGITGEFKVDGGDLWFNTFDDAGDNARWRKLAGPATAGTFHAITPFRAYDSRTTAPAPGVLATGSNRTVSIKDARDGSGTVIQTNVVPAGATAIAANVTVTDTVAIAGGGGFLTVNTGGDTTAVTSTINWSASDQKIANGVSLTLNASRQVTVICGGPTGASTNFIIDVSGYYL
ncbi:MAG: hypothetical protein ABL953_09550 [Ilumatobacteraceae bacterium]